MKNAPEAVTELQKLREALVVLANSAIDKVQLSRRYVNDLVKVQEEERARISREIHDGPLQDLTALIQRLRLLSIDMDSPASRSARRISRSAVSRKYPAQMNSILATAAKLSPDPKGAIPSSVVPMKTPSTPLIWSATTKYS